ncbi:MAG: cupin domain-containing protein [Saprospiraceae bacterium]|nr:cupin domain-containing protein [Saprospiraceae bacterium]
MYPYPFPHKISTIFGEEITFESIEMKDSIRTLIVGNRVQPGSGPPFHVHFKQEEGLTVKKGKMGYQIHGQEEKFANVGESLIFKRGEMHRFWNAGDDILECTGWICPANTIDYFLTGLYNSVNKAGKPAGDPFDGAFLLTRYKSEYDVMVVPTFVKRVIMPITVFIGKLLGKYDHFKDAPEAIN